MSYNLASSLSSPTAKAPSGQGKPGQQIRLHRLSEPLSVYLDLIRFVAAMVVFLGHVAGKRLTDGFLWQLNPYTSESVTVFFVLSGFVIAYASDQRETSARSYFIARAARIYSVALPALILTFACDAMGQWIRPDLYDASWGYVSDNHLWQFLSGLLFINRVWGINVPQGSNLAYWSLGCEVWYYCIYGIMLFGPRRLRLTICGLILLAAGPLTALLFPIWLLGAAGYQFCKSRGDRPLVGALAFFGSTAVWMLYEMTAPWHHRLAFIAPYRLHRPELVQDYIVAALFMGQIVGFQMMSSRLGFLADVSKPIRWVAGATFSLYLFHLPLAQLLASIVPWPASSWATRAFIIVGTLLLVFALAEITERRKAFWRAAIEYLVPSRRIAANGRPTMPV